MQNTEFQQVMEANKGMITAFVSKKVNNQAVSEEIVADTFIKAWQHFDTFDVSKSQITTWLHTIAGRLVIDYYRTINKQRKLEFTEMPENSDYLQVSGNVQDFASPASELIESKELQKAISAAMENLKPIQQQIVNLYFVKGRKYEEIAEILNIGMSNVKVTLLRAKAILQSKLQNEYAAL